MKRISITLMVIAIALVFSISAVYAEMAKEGTGEIRTGKSGTFEIMKMGENRLQMNWDESGAFVDAPENSPFVNASYRALGTLHSIDGTWTGQGALLVTCPNKDQIFGVLKSEGLLGKGPTSGQIELVGGTGACNGITGKMELTNR